MSAIDRATDNLGIPFFKIGKSILKSVQLSGTNKCKIKWIKEKNANEAVT